jgi:hypothetical protein
MELDKLKEFTELNKRKKELDAELKEVKKKMSDLEEQVVNEFEEEGIDSVKVNGMNVYLKQEIQVSVNGDKERANQVLIDLGLGDLVKETANIQSVKAWYRERRREYEEALFHGDEETAEKLALPETFEEAFNVYEKYRAGVRSA